MEKTSSSCDYGEYRHQTFRTGDKIKVGTIVVEPVHVDHSIPAAYGFLIHTSKGTIVYTGDLRAHGPRKDMTEEFAERARESRPAAMICEGTRMVEKEKRKNYSERQVEKLGDKVVSSTEKIVFVMNKQLNTENNTHCNRLRYRNTRDPHMSHCKSWSSEICFPQSVHLTISCSRF